jgi:hypothetical protein
MLGATSAALFRENKAAHFATALRRIAVMPPVSI